MWYSVIALRKAIKDANVLASVSLSHSFPTGFTNAFCSINFLTSELEIKSVIIYILSQKLQQLQKQVAEDKAKMFFTEAFKEIGLVVAKLGIQYFSCKIFGIKGGAVGMSLIGIFSIKDSSFTQSQFGNSNVINNLEHSSFTQSQFGNSNVINNLEGVVNK